MITPRQRLQQVDRSYRQSLKSLHDDYNRAYDAALRKHGLTIRTLMDHFSFPPEFHEDINEARQAVVSGRALAAQARYSSARDMPRGQRR